MARICISTSTFTSCPVLEPFVTVDHMIYVILWITFLYFHIISNYPATLSAETSFPFFSHLYGLVYELWWRLQHMYVKLLGFQIPPVRQPVHVCRGCTTDSLSASNLYWCTCKRNACTNASIPPFSSLKRVCLCCTGWVGDPWGNSGSEHSLGSQ